MTVVERMWVLYPMCPEAPHALPVFTGEYSACFPASMRALIIASRTSALRFGRG
jgi:hypothetical protein